MAIDQEKLKSGKKWGWLKLAVVAIVVVLAFGGWRIFRNRSADKAETAKIERGRVSQDLVLTGAVKAVEDAKLFFPVSGELIWVGVKEGDKVTKGQGLAQLSMVALRAAVSQAESNVRAAREVVYRVHDDVKGHDSDETFLQKETRTNAEVAYDNAYQALLVAKDNLRKDVLRAPFAGVISNLVSAYPGINVNAATTVVEVVNPQTIYFEVTADQTEIKDLKEGEKGRVILDSGTGEEIPVSIERIAITPKENESGTVYVVKVTFENIDLNQTRIGMTGDARFPFVEKADALYVPPKFLNSDKKGKYLKVGNANNKTYVEVGVAGEERVEVTGAIKEGQTIYD